MTTLHILSSPYSTVNKNNRIDPFSMLTWKFIHYMTEMGWSCIHYSVPGTEVDCETVQCLDKICPDNDINVLMYNKRASYEIGLRKKPGDLVLCFYGSANQSAVQAHQDLKIIEPTICYGSSAVFAPFKVFGSYAQMHFTYGERGMLMNPSWFDTVIPNAISAHEFEYTEEKGDYFLYFGRVIETKGVSIAIQATEATGQKLVIAGPGSLEPLGYKEIPKHVTIVGLCDAETRKKLMSKAKAVIGPTHYVEPFGNMVVEGYMSGTPAITSDWGGFPETVVQGVTGFRCREFKEFVSAIQNIDKIKPIDCLNYALANYEDSVVHKKFDDYLKRIIALDFYRP